MHTPANLNLMVSVPSPWAVQCVRVPFIHVRHVDKAQLRAALTNEALGIPPHRSAKTVAAELGLGIPPSIYFFLGRCCPGRVGVIAIAVPYDDFVGCNGMVSPFDTGGLFHDHLRLPWRNYPPADKSAYLIAHSIDLGGYPAYLAPFLTAFFSRAGSYWNHPDMATAIDGIPFTAPNEWQNWTFEARIDDRATVSSAKWYFSDEAYSHYLDLLADGLIDPLPETHFEVTPKPFARAEEDAINSAPAP